MKSLIVFLACLFIAGCTSVRESVTETERDVKVRAAVPAIKDTMPAAITDSTIIAEKVVNNGERKISVTFNVSDTIKSDTAKATVKRKLKRVLKELRELPVEPKALIDIQRDSVDVTAKVKDKTFKQEEEIGFSRYVEIAAIGFVVSIIFLLLIVILIKR